MLLETVTATPFSLGMLLELLFGELGPEPGALLHAESAHTGAWSRHHQSGEAAAGQRPPPAMSSERFLAVVMGLSRRRRSGLLRRSLTFCFRRERSFRLGSEAEGGRTSCHGEPQGGRTPDTPPPKPPIRIATRPSSSKHGNVPRMKPFCETNCHTLRLIQRNSLLPPTEMLPKDELKSN